MKPGKKRDLLVPLEPPYWVGTKRPSLEQDYYESADQDNVDITNSPITRFTDTGIVTEEKSTSAQRRGLSLKPSDYMMERTEQRNAQAKACLELVLP